MFDDPKCLCHPRPKKPFQKLELTLRGSKPEEFCHLHQTGAQLDIVFDFIASGISLKETIGDPTARKANYLICLQLNSTMWRFDNLKGLADNSLLLSFSMRSSFCAAWGKHKLSYKEKYQGFSPNRFESKLYSNFYQCNWSEQHLELRLPAERIVGWKTVALVLRTFKCISEENYCHMVKMETKVGVAGLDWKAIESYVMPKKKEEKKEKPVRVMFSEEDRKAHFILEKKKVAAKRAFSRRAVLMHR
ncbi:uncharacterized protein BDV14DRAFT_202937 [Aspergillus stella-maris]|uniref:uncharacterized protein n=1 Tax=Aspergillus stella-maris TaxID=1810926 RepID=UPI003CCD2E45